MSTLLKQAICCVVLKDGTKMDAGRILGCGIDGYVFRRSEKSVLKAPKLYARWYPTGNFDYDPENELHEDDLENEKQIYQRLHNVSGVATCLHISTNGIELEYYENGPMASYLTQHSAPDWASRFLWVLQLAKILNACHERRVLIFDISLRNILLAQDMSIRMIDFANSMLLPLDVDITATEVDGWSVKLDLLQLGIAVCSILHWELYEVECTSESEWPGLDRMPKAKHIHGEEVVEKCWQGVYSTSKELQADLQQIWDREHDSKFS